jgi:acetyl-CoA carboxylase biotin carboxyl carrier protein
MPSVAAHITGTVSRIEKQRGEAVKPGDVLVVLESMKMEMPVEALEAGVVVEVRVAEGQSVAEGDVLMVLG